jgi:hypothetical protein
MMHYKKTVILFLLSLVLTQVTAQSVLKGQVIDDHKTPLENVYIYNKTTLDHTHSNANGFFTLKNASVGDTIQMGLLGYASYEFLIESSDLQKTLKVSLATERITLDELVLNNHKDILSSVILVDLRANPVNSSQEILRKIPGLFIGQHAGGGKAEQIFLRGFDIDHGTDINIQVDGMPVNMVSHAHGQGYSDLHFLIPETIQKVNFGKGPYETSQGDFATAGFVNFQTRQRLEQNQIGVEIGDFNSQRLLTMFNLTEAANNTQFYTAFEHIRTDGPFESPQNFRRTNVFSKYTSRFENYDLLSFQASYFTSEWTASGQIPQRAVDNGTITRFGAIDDTEGGNTSRFNIKGEYIHAVGENGSLKTQAYYSYYDFELYSNFTFFLEDPINGDQIRQKERRSLFGASSVLSSNLNSDRSDIDYRIGVGFRGDVVSDNELSRTRNRNDVLERIQLGDIQQWNAYSFVDTDIDLGKFDINLGARLDYFNFQYEDQLQFNQTSSDQDIVISPKLNLSYQISPNVQLYTKSGIGFHSNDTRLVLQQGVDQFLAKAYGVDVGTNIKPSQKVIINTAVWYLFSEEELVYVGDAGIVEPSGRSRRYGVDFGLRYQLTDWLYFDSDFTWTHARSVDEAAGNDFIPLAPDFTYTGGLSMIDYHGFSGGIQIRYLDNRPANEDNSITARGYFITDVNVNYQWNQVEFGVSIENLFDTEWNEAQFATTSRLQNEVAPVTELHFTPGTPFFAKMRIRYNF